MRKWLAGGGLITMALGLAAWASSDIIQNKVDIAKLKVEKKHMHADIREMKADVKDIKSFLMENK